ncbi:hypothetical protein GF312_08195 [Candidatus Poribacteria bacterium]|nr:hypothetical protein [Candidatus Poribacteria bacterium]
MVKIIKIKNDDKLLKNLESVIFDDDLSRGDDSSSGKDARSLEELYLQKISKAQNEVERLINEAQKRADDIIKKAQQKAQNMEKEAYESGYKEGKKTAGEDIEEIAGNMAKAFRDGLVEMASLRDNILNRAEDDLVRLSVFIAEKLLYRELEQHPEAILDIVTKTVRSIRNAKHIVIRLNPDDINIAEEFFSDITENIKNNSELILQEDPDLESGGCIIETDTNIIDMSLDARMESLNESLNITENENEFEEQQIEESKTFKDTETFYDN